jgi:hypothetical protein
VLGLIVGDELGLIDGNSEGAFVEGAFVGVCVGERLGP